MTWLDITMKLTVIADGLVALPYGIYRLCQIEKHLRPK